MCNLTHLHVGLLLALVLTGCQLSQPAAPKRQYSLNLERRAAATAEHGTNIIRLRALRVAPPFDQKSFVYQRTDTRFESDFYHEFLDRPGVLLTEQVRQWLDQGPVFRTVLPPTSPLEANGQLEGLITDLLGDYRDPKTPKAVLGIEFWLSQDRSGGQSLQFRKQYRSSVPIDNRLPESLAAGWTRALQQILNELETDLGRSR
jgi:ABC-type uncharacterized transport system auxiliary subunit